MDTTPRSQLRISDADRDRAIAELSEHFQAGRITQDELEERTGQVLQARTGQDLAAVFADLPRHQAPQDRPVADPVTGSAAQPPAPYRSPILCIAVAACVILVAGSILGGSSSGHHGWFALAPIVIVLLVIRFLAGSRRRTWDRRAWDRRAWDHRPR